MDITGKLLSADIIIGHCNLVEGVDIVMGNYEVGVDLVRGRDWNMNTMKCLDSVDGKTEQSVDIVIEDCDDVDVAKKKMWN